jgi:hypothetical protein
VGLVRSGLASAATLGISAATIAAIGIFVAGVVAAALALKGLVWAVGKINERAEAVGMFSGAIILAQTESMVEHLNANIAEAAMNGKAYAAVVRAQTQLSIAWQMLMADLLRVLAPLAEIALVIARVAVGVVHSQIAPKTWGDVLAPTLLTQMTLGFSYPMEVILRSILKLLQEWFGEESQMSASSSNSIYEADMGAMRTAAVPVMGRSWRLP